MHFTVRSPLSRVANDRFTPIPSSPDIPDYLIDLTLHFVDENDPFNAFVLHLPYDALADELISESLPDDMRDAILAFKSEHYVLELQKESELAAGDFDSARNCRDRQDALAKSIAKQIDGIQFLATPQLVNTALASLGFDTDSLPSQNSR